jgi:glycosyltransferase involved in cell wall biosynthesis
MRLVLVTRGFPPRVGGVETLCRQLADGFAERGLDVVVVTFDRYPRQTIQRGPYTVLRLPSRGDVFEWSGRLLPVLRGLRADVCHVHNLHSSVSAAALLAHPRFVLTPHYHGMGGTLAARLAHPVYRPLARRIVAKAAAVTAVSSSEAALLWQHFGRTPLVIPNGVDPDPAGAARRPQPQRTIAVVSRLVPHKRVEAVVRALPELPGYRLHIVGDGPQRDGLLAEAARLGVRDRLTVTTERLDDATVRTSLRDATVHVNLSAAEAFSYTVLESLAAGTPVVTSGDTALAEWAQRFPGAVVTADPAKPAHVAAAVRHVAGHRVSVDLGEYALPAVLDAYERVYEQVASR